MIKLFITLANEPTGPMSGEYYITYQKVTWLSLQKKINYQDNY